jgi:hypothetical protein
MIGKTISHYLIVEKLGEGGMGEVYRAEDTKLGWQVAIKVLPDVFAHDPERLARFEREAKLLASLNHPNICSIYDIDEDEDRHFIATEMLKHRIERKPVLLAVALIESALDLARPGKANEGDELDLACIASRASHDFFGSTRSWSKFAPE